MYAIMWIEVNVVVGLLLACYWPAASSAVGCWLGCCISYHDENVDDITSVNEAAGRERLR